MLKYIQITNKNLEFATNIQMKIFPNESAYEHYKFAIKNNLDYEKYYLVYDNDDIVGITCSPIQIEVDEISSSFRLKYRISYHPSFMFSKNKEDILSFVITNDL